MMEKQKRKTKKTSKIHLQRNGSEYMERVTKPMKMFPSVQIGELRVCTTAVGMPSRQFHPQSLVNG